MKLTKILFSAGVAIPSLMVPMSTLTSCGQSWGNKTPFMIGSSEFGPYSNFSGGNFLDKNGNDIIDYIQNQYAVQTKTGQFYSYSTPFVFDEHSGETGKWTKTGESGWYQSGNEAFVMSTDKIDDPIDSKCAGNAALSSNIDFISTIGSSLNNFITYALQYQSQQVNADSETNLQIAWGGGDKTEGKKFSLNHGKKDGSDDEKKQNNEFYEHIFASANLNGKEKSEAMLKTSAINFNFDKFPLPSYQSDKIIDNYTGWLLCGDTWDDDPPNYGAYATGDPQEVEEKVGEITITYNIYTYDAVPVIINFDDITQTYLNPSNKDDSFLVNDYYSTSTQIKNSVGDQWKEMMPKLTSRPKDECIPHNKSFTLSSPSDSYCKKIDMSNLNYDERLVSNNDAQINANTFIALIGYKLKITLDSAIERPNNAVTITGLQNIFPAYFIDLYGNDLFKINKQTDTDTYYVFNQDKINDATTKLLNILRRTGKEGYETDLTKLDAESQKLLTFLGYMFGTNDNTIKTDDFIEPIEPINS